MQPISIFPFLSQIINPYKILTCNFYKDPIALKKQKKTNENKKREGKKCLVKISKL